MKGGPPPTVFSPKQWRLATMAETIQHRRIIVPGPTQCGKTKGASWGWFRYNGLNFAGHNFALCARSQQQFNRVLLPYLKHFAAEHRLALRRDEDNAWAMDSFIGAAPNVYYRALGTDSGSADKAYGPPAAGAFFDEYALMPPDFIAAIESRCSAPGAKLVYTCNPKGPHHWAKTRYVDRCEGEEADEGDFGLHIPFEMSDHPFPDPEYVRSLYQTYSGPMLRRMVFGEWAATAGLIYEGIERNVRKPPPLEEAFRFEASFDDGTSTGITHGLLHAQFPAGWWVIDEWRHDGSAEGKRDPFWKARHMVRRFTDNGRRNVSWWVGDPAAQNLRQAVALELANVYPVAPQVSEADNDLLDGIQFMDQWYRLRRGYISPECRALVGELHSYEWDEAASLRGIDMPQQKDNHGCDAHRYWGYTRAGLRQSPGAPILVKGRGRQ